MSGAELRAREYLRIIDAKYNTGQQPAYKPTRVVMARRDVTELVDEVERLREELDDMHEDAELWRQSEHDCNKANRELEAQVAKLREIISRCADAVGASVTDNSTIEFMTMLPDEIRSALRETAE